MLDEVQIPSNPECHTQLSKPFRNILFLHVFATTGDDQEANQHCEGNKKFCSLGYNDVQSVRSQPPFQKNMLPILQGGNISQKRD
jgi:hypothetical protein